MAAQWQCSEVVEEEKRSASALTPVAVIQMFLSDVAGRSILSYEFSDALSVALMPDPTFATQAAMRTVSFKDDVMGLMDGVGLSGYGPEDYKEAKLVRARRVARGRGIYLKLKSRLDLTCTA
ncbi:hypothetical protein K438DRAFT_1753575 [Mycena galopus ATCC 62051]|nr:hypothetical protein K438DRAFT_1753575 [Mycena galopus ATCC 62051]